MTRSKSVATAAVALTAVLSMAACSSSGGKAATESSSGSNAGVANTPKITIAMITHQSPGDTFWDIIRKGAEAASAKDNVTLQYSNNDDASKQAQLIQAAIDKKVDDIAVTDPNTGALGATIKKAIAAGIPVTMFNAGGPDALGLGALGYFGQGEKDAGTAVGKRVVADGGKNILCVIQEQGQQQLEDRCAGVTSGAGGGAKVSKIYVNGSDDSAVTTSIQAKLGEDRHVRHEQAARRGRPGRFGHVGDRPAALPPGLPGRRLPLALQDERQHARRRQERRDGPGVHRQVQHRPGVQVRRQRHAVTTRERRKVISDDDG